MDEQDIFLAALQISDFAERESYLESACGDNLELKQNITHLLYAHQKLGDFLATPHPALDAAPTRIQQTGPTDGAGLLIAGRYKLIQSIGEGGMGAVWMAEQKEPLRRLVALKLIKPGMDTATVLARFEAERQALCLMDHPHIAKIFDAGVTDLGRPFFAMELVRGVPLTDYCDQVRASVRERLELFNQVCSAVQHAHQKGIIHRDLKPSNVLVTEYDGQPIAKVIDFGLAKALQHSTSLTEHSLHTAFGSVIGTPLYMAPEQLGTSAVDVDTRSDLYSLGVILYELLTGTTPIERQRVKEAAWDEIRRIVREEEPPIPSKRISSSSVLPSLEARRHADPGRLSGLVRGDLDWIIMKALEKDRNRRYETASSLTLDINRHLAGDAVLAAPPSQLYRLNRLVRRYRAWVVAGSLLLLTLICGIAGTSYGLIQAKLAVKAEKIANAEAEKRRIEAENQRLRAIEREQLAIAAIKRFADAVSNNPELKNNPALAPLRKELLKEPQAFFVLLQEKLLAEKEVDSVVLERLAYALFELGVLSNEIGNKEDALKAFEESLEIEERLRLEERDSPTLRSNLAISYLNLGVLCSDLGRIQRSRELFEKAAAIQAELVKEDASFPKHRLDLAKTQINLGNSYLKSSNYDLALTSHEKAAALLKGLMDEHPDWDEYQENLAICYVNIGALFSQQTQNDNSIAAYDRAVEIQKRLLSKNPTSERYQAALASSLQRISVLEFQAGHFERAISACETSIEVQERLLTSTPSLLALQSELGRSYLTLGEFHIATDRRGDALPALQKAREIQHRLVQENPTTVNFQIDLGVTLTKLAALANSNMQHADARDFLKESIKLLAGVNTASSQNASSFANLGHAWLLLIKTAQALRDDSLIGEAESGFAKTVASAPEFAAMEARLAQVKLPGDATPPKELLELASHAYNTRRFELAARLWSAGLNKDPTLAEDRKEQHAYNAACASVLAANGEGSDANHLTNEHRSRLLAEARVWLGEELDRWQTIMRTANSEQQTLIRQTLTHWRSDPDLHAIRDELERAELSTVSRQEWVAFWKQVEVQYQAAKEAPVKTPSVIPASIPSIKNGTDAVREHDLTIELQRKQVTATSPMDCGTIVRRSVTESTSLQFHSRQHSLL